MPRIDDVLDGVGQVNIQYLSTMDVASGFHQIPCSAEASEKLAFTYPGGMYQYLFMPFGVKNAPSVWQRFMDSLFRDIPRSEAKCYVDDILVKSENIDQQIVILNKIFKRFEEAGVMISIKKSKFLRKAVDYLGLQLS